MPEKEGQKLLFVVGEFTGGTDDGLVGWDMCGVFDDIDVAEKFCTEDNFFVGPLLKNMAFPKETVDWPGCYYPKTQDRPKLDQVKALIRAQSRKV